MTVGTTIGALGIVAGLVLGFVFLFFRQGVVEFRAVGDRAESVGSVDPLPHRTAVQARSGRDHRRSSLMALAVQLPRHALSRVQGGEHRSGRRCCAMSEAVLAASAGPDAQLHPGRRTIEVLRGVDLRSRRARSSRCSGRRARASRRLLQAVGLLEGGFDGSIRIAGEEAARARCARPHARAPRVARLRLSVPPSAARFQRDRECRAAAADPRRRPRRGATSARDALLDRARPRPPADAPAEPAVGRRAAARRGRARARQPAGAGAGRRADRQSRRGAPPTSCWRNSSGWCAARARRRWSRRITSGSPRKMDRVVRLHEGTLE